VVAGLVSSGFSGGGATNRHVRSELGDTR
jgi:hypothetical protein